jgi:hypothetical protein
MTEEEKRGFYHGFLGTLALWIIIVVIVNVLSA